MIYKETLSWILDHKHMGEKEYQINIDFVHSLGKKCDCVGWSELDMDDPDAEKVLEEIKKFCRKNRCNSRGCYKRVYTDYTSDWFELKTTHFKDESIADFTDLISETGEEISIEIIRAYHEHEHSPKERVGICVPERFRNACFKNNIKNIDFCWVEDKGKYKSEQYFHIYPHNLIPRIACVNSKKLTYSQIKSLGGFLPKINSVFSKLQFIDLQECYLAEDLPSSGIAYVYKKPTNSNNGHNKILIHKDTAEVLIREKALRKSDLITACVLDICPKGYILEKTQVKPKPTNDYIEKSLVSYKKLINTERPVRSITEKDALKILRKAKKQRKDDFTKKLSKAKSEILSDEYQMLTPYYQITNGGYLSDEYEMLSYEKSVVTTKQFFSDLEKEELLVSKPIGTVFAETIDGDAILIQKDGKIIRFSHEEPTIINEWQSIAQFFFDALNDYE